MAKENEKPLEMPLERDGVWGVVFIGNDLPGEPALTERARIGWRYQVGFGLAVLRRGEGGSSDAQATWLGE